MEKVYGNLLKKVEIVTMENIEMIKSLDLVSTDGLMGMYSKGVLKMISGMVIKIIFKIKFRIW